ncbi:MAG: HD domain-containing protein [Candidatus Omnitrophica bacterium]|nr:HD domain-containing protein [Candidatus Omnitrophota bacterium]
MPPKFYQTFQLKATLLIIFSMCLVVGISDIVVHQFAVRNQFEQLRDRLKVIARTAALTLDADTLKGIPLTREGMKTPQYQTTALKLREIKGENTLITFIYVMKKTDRPGIWEFVVDPDPELKRGQGITSYPGDKYSIARFPEMLKAYDGATADREIEKDAWGVTLSGYAPIKDINGSTVAVLGIDMLASDVAILEQGLLRRTIFIFFLGLIVASFVAYGISRHITNPVNELIAGTRQISKGNLDYEVRVKGKDEIAELAMAFNKMANELKEARHKNHNYFYGVIQSLVRIVEAKDHYTRGHSERVAEYSSKIAVQMGFTPEEVEMLEQVAVLHDIGKLAIRDDILNKPGKLNDEEWEIVRNHPLIGEDILRPVSLTPEMLAIVRGHHERYDGKGYPDGLRGERINIFSQILSVADAYDAMTSSRAYRSALGALEALAEIERNRGTQFSPRIVDAFTQVIQTS